MTLGSGDGLGGILKSRNLSQRKLAALSGLGTSHVNRIARGVAVPSLDDVYAIGRALELDPAAVVVEFGLESADGFRQLMRGALLPIEQAEQQAGDLAAARAEIDELAAQLKVERDKVSARDNLLRTARLELSAVFELRASIHDLEIERDVARSQVESISKKLRHERRSNGVMVARLHAFQIRIAEQENGLSDVETKQWATTGLGVLISGLVGAVLQEST